VSGAEIRRETSAGDVVKHLSRLSPLSEIRTIGNSVGSRREGVERTYRGYLIGLTGDDTPSEHIDGQRRFHVIQITDSE
jgi:hypothetical protein